MTPDRRPPAAVRPWVLLAAMALACSGAKHFENPKADLSTVQRVAVMPFESMTEERLSGDKVQRLFVAELLNTRRFDVVEPARVIRALREEKVESVAAMSPEDVQKIGRALKVEGIFFGTVLDFVDAKGTSGAPNVTAQFKLVETGSGTTVWATTVNRSGTTMGTRLLGFSPPPLTVVASELIRDALRTIPR